MYVILFLLLPFGYDDCHYWGVFNEVFNHSLAFSLNFCLSRSPKDGSTHFIRFAPPPAYLVPHLFPSIPVRLISSWFSQEVYHCLHDFIPGSLHSGNLFNKYLLSQLCARHCSRLLEIREPNWWKSFPSWKWPSRMVVLLPPFAPVNWPRPWKSSSDSIFLPRVGPIPYRSLLKTLCLSSIQYI